LTQLAFFGATAVRGGPPLLALTRAKSLRTCLADPKRGAPDDERYWAKVREAFELSSGQINLATAVRGVTTRAVRARIEAETERLNSFRARERGRFKLDDPDWRDQARASVAAFIGVEPSEVALVRNTTEGVTTVLLEWPLLPGDEILTTSTEHGPFYDTLARRATRDGVVIRRVHLPVPAPSAEALIAAIEASLGPHTRLVMVSHVALTGQILPVRAIADRVHSRGAHLLVDGVLGIGQVTTDLRAMDCDFYAAGFHKWGCGPRATAVFWVRPELVARLPSLFGSVRDDPQLGIVPQWDSPNITKYETYGAHPESQLFALADALEFLSTIGLARIQARLFWLTRRWAARAAQLEGFRLAVRLDPAHCAGLAAWDWPRYVPRQSPPFAPRPLVSPEGRILVGVTGSYGGVFGIPEDARRRLWIANAGIFTTAAEVDQFAEALDGIAKARL
jgi:selenocysteine lyase/cysteine desulfurase